MDVKCLVLCVWTIYTGFVALCSKQPEHVRLSARVNKDQSVDPLLGCVSSSCSPFLCSEKHQNEEEYEVLIERKKKEPAEAVRDLKKRVTNEIEKRIKAGKKARAERKKSKGADAT